MRLVHCDRIARRFAIAALVWGVVALGAGLLLALERVVAVDLPPFLAFGRMLPVHTALAVFALVGNVVFAGMYHSSQRLLAARIQFPRLAGAHLVWWQLAAAAAAVGTPAWAGDVAVALGWLLFAVNLAAMIRRRGEPRLYVSIWFYLAATITVPAFHILHQLPLAAGVGDAMVEAWYAQMAVGFFLTMPVLGLIYDLAPRAAGRPLHSYRIAILHFWALVILAGWAAPQPLLNTAAPDWAQALAPAAVLLLFAPGLAGLLNGLLTLRGTGARLRTDPVLKFLAAALFFAVIGALEAPLLATRSGSSLLQYTDWVGGRLHLGALGLDGFMAAALLYWLVPRLWGTELRSRAAAGAHFYLATVGLLLYVASMWIAGATQGVMLRAEDATRRLVYTFIETAVAIELPLWGRALGGALYLAGFVVMAGNLAFTIRRGRPVDEEQEVAGGVRAAPVGAVLRGRPVVVAALVMALVVAAGLANPLAAVGLLMVALLVALAGAGARALDRVGWHQRLEGSGLAMAILIAAAVLVAAAVQLAPVLAAAPAPRAAATPLEEAGRRVYVAEGCGGCHSQMIRPFLWEVARYGEVSTAADSAGERPALWGSRRIGPDLARIGGRFDDDWHRRHLIDPRTVAFASTMPSYRHLDDGEMTALIAYLQRLGARR